MSLIDVIRGRQRQPEPEPTDSDDFVADSDGFERIADLHVPSTAKYANAYVTCVVGSVLGTVASIESATCVVLRYAHDSPYSPNQRMVCVIDFGAFGLQELIFRVQQLATGFGARIVFAPDIMTHDLLRRRMQRRTIPLFESMTLDVAQLIVTELHADLDAGKIIIPSAKGVASRTVELVKSELLTWDPQVPPSTGLLALATCVRATHQYAPKVPLGHYISNAGGIRLYPLPRSHNALTTLPREQRSDAVEQQRRQRRRESYFRAMPKGPLTK